MKPSIFLSSLFFLATTFLHAQKQNSLVSGKVVEVSDDGIEVPVYGANVYWVGTINGTSTDPHGHFSIEAIESTKKLVTSYVGFHNDTLLILEQKSVHIILNSGMDLSQLDVTHRQKSMHVSWSDPMKTENIGEKELLKAACCNLSESFETNPSVDVSFTDAVTGTRQIQLLGLAGPYTQITRENMPDIRGLSALYGLSYIPGPWIQSIQLNKGAGSVANGFESIAGQINVELRKPEEADRLYLNLYANESGRMEINANLAYRIKNSSWSTALLLHGKRNSIKWDRNNDGFLDTPIGHSFIGLNRWKYIGADGLMMQFGIKGTFTNNYGGQMNFDPENDALTTNYWGMRLNVNRYEGWAKIGKVFLDKTWKTFGFQFSGIKHQQKSYFGLNQYDADQHSFYANFLYQSIIGNTNHKFRTGASFQYDNYSELLNESVYNRNEIVPGVYFEYTVKASEKLSAVAGIRFDYHNNFGAFLTPRLHVRYAISDNLVIRASGGRGERTASIIAENIGLLASSRQIIIQGDESDKPYGLKQEVAWNYGINLTQSFRLAYRDGSIGFDFYRTQFENQIVVDVDQSPQTALFYNLDGQSFSNSFQAQVDYELIKRLDVRLAYRWFDVRTTYHENLLQKPLIAINRAFINLAYETRNHWKFDLTINWQGQKRIPFTNSNPPEYQLAEQSPDFVVINTQISKSWNENFEVYLGAENLFNYKQENPILSADKPFSPYFDASLIWGPVFGRNIYAGLRYKIK